MTVPLIIFAGLILLFLVFFTVKGIRFSIACSNIRVGMSYEEVVSMLGEPRSTTYAEEIMTCVWRKTFLRDWVKVFVIAFKDSIVLSTSNV